MSWCLIVVLNCLSLFSGAFSVVLLSFTAAPASLLVSARSDSILRYSPQTKPTSKSSSAEPAAPRCSPALPELLAPAGDWDCARAAVENGADAIYFGLDRFNARMRAKNFAETDLPAVVEFVHRRGVRA